jgi:hypothetical protein
MRNRTMVAMTMTAGLLLPAPAVAQTAAGRGTPPPPPPQFRAPQTVQPTPVDPRLWPQAFSVVLVVGELEGTQASDAVPAAARKALTDMKDFLPYKSYRLLDSQWTLCCGKGSTFSRLRGLDDQEYELTLTPAISEGVPGGKATVNVRFVLVEAGGFRGADVVVEALNEKRSVADAERLMQMEAQLRGLQQQRQETLQSRGPQHPEVLELASRIASLTREMESLKARQAAAQRRDQARPFVTYTPHSRRQIIDASFRMDVGETVVVGTSRIHGDKALIALLTAVPPKK